MKHLITNSIVTTIKAVLENNGWSTNQFDGAYTYFKDGRQINIKKDDNAIVLFDNNKKYIQTIEFADIDSTPLLQYYIRF
jgi:hypothetical protein